LIYTKKLKKVGANGKKFSGKKRLQNGNFVCPDKYEEI